MKTLAVLLVAATGVLSGCVAYEVPNREGPVLREYRQDQDRYNRRGHDRDHDGVPDRADRRPNDPRRY